MALLAPSQIHAVLKQTGLKSSNANERQTELDEILDKNSLGPNEVIEAVGELMRGSSNEGTRLQAAKIGLELNRLLADSNKPAPPSVQIIIQNAAIGEINPILIPR